MKKIHLTLFCIFLTILLTACGSGSEESDANTPAQSNAGGDQKTASSSSKLFDRDIRKQVCELLTADMVAEVSGVDPSLLEQLNTAGMCIYSWDEGQASLGHLRTSDTAEWARDSFENSYRNKTGEEVKADMDKIQSELEKKNTEGTTDVDPEKAKTVTGAMSSAFAGGFQYENIDGLGDAASFEVTRTEMAIGGHTIVSYANSLNVLVGNLKFTVGYNLEGEPQLYRDENAALAKAVIEKLEN